MTVQPIAGPAHIDMHSPPFVHEKTMAMPRFALSVGVIISAFLVLEIAYAFRLPRGMDEFAGARFAYLVTKSVPYRDFTPAKTVLSYYVQAPAAALVRDTWHAMTAIRIEVAALWAAVLAAAATVLRREIDERAIIGALAMTAVMSTFAERALEIRPDTIAAIFGLASLLALIARRPGLAGFFCAASFCSTQKAIYLVLAGGLAVLAMAVRDRTRAAVLDVFRFGIVSAASLATYLLFWIVISSRQSVFGSVFFDQNIKAIALRNLYPDMHARFWTQTIIRNPVFYAAALIGLVTLIPRWTSRRTRVPVIVPYTLVLTPLCIWHKQPWPYFFVLLVPTLFVLIAVALSELGWNRTVVTIVVAGGVLIPLTRLPITLTRGVTAFQKAMVETGEQLLDPADTYLDGTNLLYRHKQAAPEWFGWVDGTTLYGFSHLNRDDQARMVAAADRGHPKLVIWSYRMAGLPMPMQAYIFSHFLRLYGDLLFYGPAIRAPRFSVAFDGEYRVSAPAVIDGSPARDAVTLRRGMHTLSGVTEARLKLLPPRGLKVDPQFAAPRNLFEDLFDY